MLSAALQEMQDEAAKDEETRRNEQLAWEFIREEQRRHAAGSSLKQLERGVRPGSSDGAPQAAPASQAMDTFQEAANLLRSGLKVVNLRAAATHTSGNSRFRVPLPGPPGVSGWAVARNGNVRLGVTDPTRRWAGMKKGLTTLDYRLHKGVHVPTAEERAYLNLGKIQKPLAARMQERAVEQKLKEMLQGRCAADSASQGSPQGNGKHHWGKVSRKSAAVFRQGGGAHAETSGAAPQEPPEPQQHHMHAEDTEGVAQKDKTHAKAESGEIQGCQAQAEDREGPQDGDGEGSGEGSGSSSGGSSSDAVSGMSLLQVSSLGVGQMGVVDVVEASFEAQELQQATRRQVALSFFLPSSYKCTILHIKTLCACPGLAHMHACTALHLAVVLILSYFCMGKRLQGHWFSASCVVWLLPVVLCRLTTGAANPFPLSGDDERPPPSPTCAHWRGPVRHHRGVERAPPCGHVAWARYSVSRLPRLYIFYMCLETSPVTSYSGVRST